MLCHPIYEHTSNEGHLRQMKRFLCFALFLGVLYVLIALTPIHREYFFADASYTHIPSVL